jgi:hypothetical protein
VVLALLGVGEAAVGRRVLLHRVLFCFVLFCAFRVVCVVCVLVGGESL